MGDSEWVKVSSAVLWFCEFLNNLWSWCIFGKLGMGGIIFKPLFVETLTHEVPVLPSYRNQTIEFCSFVILWIFTPLGLISMLLYKKLHGHLGTTYCRAIDAFLVLGAQPIFIGGQDLFFAWKTLSFS